MKKQSKVARGGAGRAKNRHDKFVFEFKNACLSPLVCFAQLDQLGGFALRN
jgi:hypothetical protein